MYSVLFDREQHRFRSWQLTDLPFLIHYSAMARTIIRFQVIVTISSLYAKSSERMLQRLLSVERSRSHPRVLVQEYLALIHSNLDNLLNFANNIDKLRGNEQSIELNEHDDRRIFKFIEHMRELTYDIQACINEEGPPVSVLFQRLMMIREGKYRIPVVSNLDRLYETFDCINQVEPISPYYFLD